MNTRYIGPVLLLAALVIGDQIRIHRPDHKYRLTVEVETPRGIRSASGVMSVHPDRSYARGGSTKTKGDAVLVDLGGGDNLIALMAHIDKSVELDEINFVALQAYQADGQKAVFKRMDRLTGAVPVRGAAMPVLATFADLSDPETMRTVKPDDIEATLGNGYRLKAVFVEVVPNGYWPLDFGGALGKPVTRGIVAKLPWLKRADGATRAVRAAGLIVSSEADAKRVFTRD